jgi:hypothetical protein
MKTLIQAILTELDRVRPNGQTEAELTEALATAGGPMADLALVPGNVWRGLTLLTRGGALEFITPGCYRTTRAYHEDASMIVYPRNAASGIAARAWWVMRKQGAGFSVSSLCSAVANEDELAAQASISQYVLWLKRSGYLLRKDAGHGVSALNKKRYSLVRNSGPLAPALRRNKGKVYCVYDGNTGDIYPVGWRS